MRNRTSPVVQPPDFDAMYTAEADPFQVESSWYESRKLSVLMASLPRERYAMAWEPGCGLGVGSVALAHRTERLVASDSSKVAVEAARRRCRDLPHVRCVQSVMPEVPVDGPADLVVVAEFLYYVPEFDEALQALLSSLALDGQLAIMHWAHRPHDAFRSGPEMHARLARDAAGLGLTRLVEHIDEDFLLDIYERHQ